MNIVNSLGLSGYLPDMSIFRSTQDFINVKSIENGMIVTKDDRYIKILEVLPINFDTRPIKDKDRVIFNFAQWLMIAPINIQIKIMTENSDPSLLIKQVEDRYKNEDDYAVEPLVKNYVNLLRALHMSGTIAKKFYLIISYDETGVNRATDLQDISMELAKKTEIVKSYFMKMGNIVNMIGESLHSPNASSQEIWSTSELLYKFLNPRTSQKVSFKKRVQRLYSDTKTVMETDDAKPPIDSLIAPTGIDVSPSDCVVIDGRYYTYLLVPSSGYPSDVWAGWFEHIFKLKAGESVDIFLHKIPKNKMLQKTSSGIKFTGVKLSEKNETQMDYEQTENALSSAMYIKKAINNNGEEPFYITTMITLSDDRYESLMDRREELMESLKSQEITLLTLPYLQEEAMYSSLPLLQLSPKLFDKGKRNIMTLGVASSFPFVSADMTDEGGFMIGTDTLNGTLCIINPFDRKAYANGNTVILGTSGAGKTYLQSVLALRMRATGTQCFIIAPLKAHEFTRACRGVQGSFVKISAASRSHINVMDIRPVDNEVAKILQGEDILENNIYLADKIQTIITFISLLVPDLENDEEQTIDTCCVKAYARYGITEDNDSIYVDPTDKSKGLKEMPTLGDLYEELENSEISKRILQILQKFTTGSAKSFNRRTNVDLDNKFIVFDLSALDGRMIPAGMFIAFDFIMGRIKENVLEQKMVFIDEVWQLIGAGGNAKAAEFVQRMAKILRGYNAAMSVSTQDISDFFALDGGKYGSAVIANSQIKILLKMEESESSYLKGKINLNYNELRDLEGYSKGQCIVCAGSNHIPMQVIASPWEHQLITTDAANLKKVYENMLSEVQNEDVN